MSKFQCGFKGYSTQHCLLLMLEKWKLNEDNNETFGALSADLSKAFDCLSQNLLIAELRSYDLSLSQNLLIAELRSYDLSLTSPRLLSDYLSNRKQQIKVENVFSKW